MSNKEFTGLSAIFEIKRVALQSQAIRPEISIKLANAEGSKVKKQLQLVNYAEHLFNNEIKRVVFDLKDSDDQVSEFEWVPNSEIAEDTEYIEVFNAQWQKKHNKAMPPDVVDRFLKRLPEGFDQSEIDKQREIEEKIRG